MAKKYDRICWFLLAVWFAIMLIVYFPRGCSAGESYTMYDERLYPIYRVVCDDYNFCKVYDMRGYLRYTFMKEGKIYDERLYPKGEVK